MLGNTWVPEFVALDALEPLDSRVASSKDIVRSDYFQGIWDTNTVGNVTYGIPWYVDTRVIFYRSDLLAKAGCPQMPSTWASWRQCMVQLKSRMNDHQYPLLIPISRLTTPPRRWKIRRIQPAAVHEGLRFLRSAFS
jgi:multiple sugar transport system substrate-binding protein